MSNERLDALAAAGVSIWLDDLSRDRINTGNLADLVSNYSVTGVTTNPTIFATALSKGEAYNSQIKELAARFDIEAAVHEGAVTFAVAEGAAFVPRLFAGLEVPINSVTVTRPSLDDVFLAYTGRTIRDAEAARPMSGMAFAARGR